MLKIELSSLEEGFQQLYSLNDKTSLKYSNDMITVKVFAIKFLKKHFLYKRLISQT